MNFENLFEFFRTHTAFAGRSKTKACYIQTFQSIPPARYIASADNVRIIVILIVQYVYILRCINNHPCIGCTDNLKERVERHINGCFEDKYLAFNFEKYLKTCSGRVLMNKRLINDPTKLKAK